MNPAARRMRNAMFFAMLAATGICLLVQMRMREMPGVVLVCECPILALLAYFMVRAHFRGLEEHQRAAFAKIFAGNASGFVPAAFLLGVGIVLMSLGIHMDTRTLSQVFVEHRFGGEAAVIELMAGGLITAGVAFTAAWWGMLKGLEGVAMTPPL